MAVVKPVVKSIFVCDDVVLDPQTGKVSVLNLWDAVRVPPGGGFPYCLAKVNVFVWWRGGLGQVKTRIDVVQASSGNVIRKTKDHVLNFGARFSSIHGRYGLPDCVFPAPGHYFVELYCEDAFVDDQVIRVLPP